MREIEVKLAIEGAVELPDFTSEGHGVVEVRALDPVTLRATYHDTEGLRLAHSGITLRWRSGDDDGSAWTLKLPVEESDATERRELRFAGGARSAPAEARSLLTAYLRHQTLAPVARLRTVRKRWLLMGNQEKELAEISHDVVSVLEGNRVTGRFSEIEIEGRSLDRAGVERLAEVFRDAGAVPAAPSPKLARAVGIVPGAASERERVDLRPTDRAGLAVQAVLNSGFQRLVGNDPATRLGEIEPLHQMRVATRRLRSDLRTISSLLDQAWTDETRSELKWLGGLLGAVRDTDVLSERFRSSSPDLEQALSPIHKALSRQRDRDFSLLSEALVESRYVELLERLDAARGRPLLTVEAQQLCSEALPPLVLQAWKKARRQAASLGPDPSDEDLHRLRILTKRARYAAEAVADPLEDRRVMRFANRAADVQDALGELQDAVMAQATIERLVARERRAGVALAAGRLLERELAAAAEARNTWIKPWSKLDDKKLVAWMKS
ncbi:MAG TPA: CYTH and CHAD domain-containing protein [Actinomycetota bacterium]|nr:CYTH and CHAD domain-containing protein [Actinomycetota bacterium]